MANSSPPRRPGKTAGLVLLFAIFLIFCALVMALTGLWRAYRGYTVESHWTETSARIEKCLLSVYHPFERNGGGTTYSLGCQLSFDYGLHHVEYRLHTRSDRSPAARTAIRNWIRENPPGTTLAVRVNPSNPNDVAVESDLPLRQYGTPRDAGLTALVFGAPGLALFAIGRKLARPAL